MNTLLSIEGAFRHRSMPASLFVYEMLTGHELDDVVSFTAEPWSCVTGPELEKHFDAIFRFTPEAFCYYLPGILSAGIRENKPWLIVNHSLVNMLDRSPDPSSWDDFFLARWPQLTAQECEATQAWILWLSSFNDSSYTENALSRAFDTLELIRQRDLNALHTDPADEHLP